MHPQDPITSFSPTHVQVAAQAAVPPPSAPYYAPPSAAPDISAPGTLLRFARGFYWGGLIALLLLFSPLSWLPGALLKIAVFAICMIISVVCFSAGGGMAGYVRSPRMRYFGLAILLPIVYVVSWFVSTDKTVGLIGFGTEVDTVLFIALAFVAFVMGNALMRGSETSRNLLRAVGVVAFVAMLFQLFDVLLGAHVFAVLGNPTFNLIGDWNDFGLFSAFGTILALARLELYENSTVQKVLLWIAVVLGAFLLAIVNFNIAWWVALLGAVLVSTFQLIGMRRAPFGRTMAWKYSAIFVVIVSVAFLAAGGYLNARLPKQVSVASLEVRPALAATYGIAQASHASLGRFFIGSGPNTFGEAWLLHKPASVNQTQFWNFDFTTGFSIIESAYQSVGILGVAAWLLPLAMIIWGLWRALGTQNFENEDKNALVLGVLALMLWIALLTYSSGQDMTLLAFVLAGAFVASLRARPLAGQPNRSAQALGGVLAALSIVLIIVLAGTVARRTTSVAYAQQAALALQKGDPTSAALLDQKSESIENTGTNAQLGLAIDTAVLQHILSATSSAQTQQEFENASADAINDQGKKAIALAPNDYQSYAALANVYGILASVKTQGAYEESTKMYQRAMALDPTNPELPLLLAQTEAAQNGNIGAVQNLVNQALVLKSNFTDALVFDERLAIAQNDLAGATRAAALAAQSAPNQASLWYQLGLYYYAAEDWKGAGAAFAQALSLEPNYANAQYFLGLTDYQLGNSQGALVEFEAVQKTNPQNAMVSAIVSNLKAGKNPLAGLTSQKPAP